MKRGFSWNSIFLASGEKHIPITSTSFFLEGFLEGFSLFWDSSSSRALPGLPKPSNLGGFCRIDWQLVVLSSTSILITDILSLGLEIAEIRMKAMLVRLVALNGSQK